ncbi:MAG: FliH/SctL family protein [Syntrophothermus sp.]
MKSLSPAVERVRYLSNVIKIYEWRRAEPYQLPVYPAERLQEEIQKEIQAELEARRLEEEQAALMPPETVEEQIISQEMLAGETAGQSPLGAESSMTEGSPAVSAPMAASPDGPSNELSSIISSVLSPETSPELPSLASSSALPAAASQAMPQIEKLLESAAEKAKALESEAQKAAESLKTDAQRVLAQAEGARKEAEAQLASARQEAARLVEEAREQAADLLEKAQKEAEQILEEAKERGLQEGLAQGREAGHREGYEAGIGETSRLAEQAKTVLETALAEREQLIRGASGDILKLVVKIAEKIIRGQLRLDPAIIQRTIEDAVKLVNDKTRVVIRVNPSELETAKSGEARIRQFLEGSTKLEIVADETIEAGGCMIETNSGSVDARIATQLEETAHLLEGLVHGG